MCVFDCLNMSFKFLDKKPFRIIWKSSKRIISKPEKKPKGAFIEESQTILVKEEIGVVKATVSKAAHKVAKGYFAIFISLN